MERKILLLCLKIKSKDEVPDEDELKVILGGPDIICKLSIFERSPILKGFVEFLSNEHALSAVRELHDKKTEFGILKLYPSAKNLVIPFETPTQEFAPQPKDKLQSRKFMGAMKIDMNFNEGNFYQQIQISDQNGDFHQKKVKHSPEFKGKFCKGDSFGANPIKNDSDQCYFQKNSDIWESITKTGFDFAPTKNLLTDPLNNKFQQNDKNQIFSEDKFQKTISLFSMPNFIPACGVRISNINLSSLGRRSLANILCCFGNVLESWKSTAASTLIAVFRSPSEAQRTLRYLQGLLFMSLSLSVHEIKPQEVNKIRKGIEENVFECVPVSSSDHRFQDHLKVRFNPPSKFIHIANLSPELDHAALYNIIRVIHEPVKIMKLVRKSKSLCLMFIVEFESAVQGLEVLVGMHNLRVNGCKICVSFSQPSLA